MRKLLSEDISMPNEVSIVQRGKKGTFHLRIVYPTRLRHVFKANQHWESLKTTDSGVAILRAGPKVASYLKLVQSNDFTNPDDLDHVRNAAAAHGLDYCPDTKIVALPVEESVEALSPRLEAWDKLKQARPVEKAAIAGAAKETLPLDKMFSRYQELASGKWADLDDRARKKKWNRYSEPVADFKETMGINDVLSIKSKDAFDYAAKLGKRIEEGKLKSETAKKKLLFLSAMIRKVLQADFPDHKNPFENATIDHEGDGETRKPFTEEEAIAVRKKIAESDANDELKAICTILELTGCHAKEIVLLSPSDIHVGPDVEIPFISIGVNENRKRLKTGGARHRDIPLLPEAIEIFERFPNGFSHYCYSGGADNFTQSANKLIQTVAEGKTTYSWRHRLVDLLRNHREVKDDMLKAIVGHNAGQTGDYGEGFDLENKLDALEKAQERAALLRSKIKTNP